MANEQRELLEILIGAVMAQSVVCEFLVKSGVVERAALVEHLAAPPIVRKRIQPAPRGQRGHAGFGRFALSWAASESA
jgi:hypothetical protein